MNLAKMKQIPSSSISPNSDENKQRVYPVQMPIFDDNDSSEDDEGRRAGGGRLSMIPANNPATDDARRLLVKRKSRLDGLKELELDGFSSLAEATTCCARVFWLIFLVVVLSILTQQIYKTVTGYIDQPVVSTFTVTYNDSLKFPSLLVCPGNFINETAFKLFPREAKASLAYQIVLFNQSPNITKKKRHKRDTQNIWDAIDLNKPDFDFSAGLDDILRSLFVDDPQSLYNGGNNFDGQIENDDNFVERFRRSEPNDTDISINGSKVDINQTRTNSTNGTVSSSQGAPKPRPTLFDLASNMTPAEMYQGVMKVGFDSKQVFLECHFANGDSLEKIPCDEIVKDILDSNYGKCYLVSVGDRMQTVESKGLVLTINSMNSQNSRLPQAIKRYKGLFLSVDDGSNPASWEKVLVSGGLYMKMELSLQHLKLLNVQSGDDVQPCIENDKANLQIFNVSYSLQSCQIDCFVQEIARKCGCILLTDKLNLKTDILKKYGFCQTEVLQNCVLPNVVNNQESSDIVEDCKDICYIQCDSWRYTMSPSTMALNPVVFSRFAPIPTSDIVHLEVAYRSLEYSELIQSYQITVDTFIGNLGGQITLWIGGSMIALVNVPIMISSFLFKYSLRRASTTLTNRQEFSQETVTSFQDIIKARLHRSFS